MVEELEDAVGATIDRSKLLERIGEGGVGAVYMAEQRRVALEIVRVGMNSKQDIARFEAERQALALMQHPNIARVLDAGTRRRASPARGHQLGARDRRREVLLDDRAVEQLTQSDPRAADVVRMRFDAGRSIEGTAEVL